MELFSETNDKPYVWVYWETKAGSKMPSHIKLCLDSIKLHCSTNFNVQILDNETVLKYLPDLRTDLNKLLLAQKVDYVRIALLYTYGGIWIDADTILMNDLSDIKDKLNKWDYVGFGCTGLVCKNGYPNPSNGVMGAQKNSILMKNCLNKLNKMLDEKNSNYGYFDLGKIVIWEELDALMKTGYNYLHYGAEFDGSRDKNGHWIHSPNHLDTKEIEFLNADKLFFVFLANNELSNDPKYTWILEKTEKDLLEGPWAISQLFKKSLSKAFPKENKNLNQSNDIFSKFDIWIINLKSKPEKKAFIQNQLTRLNLNGNFFEAVDGNTLNIQELENTNVINQNASIKAINRILRRGEIGCSLSHINVWKNFLNSDKEYLLILEDDSILSHNFRINVNDLFKELTSIKWDCFFLSENCYRFYCSECNGKQITKNIMRPNNIGVGAYGYIMTKKLIAECLTDVYPLVYPIDNYLINKQKGNKNLVFLRTINPLIHVDRGFESDTQGIK
jgi:glycosyl transferase family 25